MKTVALTEAKDRLSALVDEVEREHEIVRVTRHGRTSAILISESDLDSLHDTIFWLSQPGIRDDIAEARKAYVGGRSTSAHDLRARYGLASA
ncbi:MAG: type II toxin-antitoxin system Phd/YefM family antitoxin [Propionibacteriaceae bacterium]|jgi:prevent-host-death family protein|nr:type II toxin-antitoxin system Phd/YefM family antitoxin [Propionibacteriaceae bacterium]